MKKLHRIDIFTKSRPTSPWPNSHLLIKNIENSTLFTGNTFKQLFTANDFQVLKPPL